MQKLLTLLLILGLGYFGWDELGLEQPLSSHPVETDAVLENAYQNRLSDLQVEGSGRVVALLADDNDGSPHQRFIIRLNSGQTVLIAHNTALAARIPNLGTGDTVAFYGEYEWNSRGGVVHWTHNDPQNRHAAGWLKHNGRTYQ